MRNPFRRQTETAAPSLRERAAALREGLSRQAAPTPAPAERADLYDRLLVAYAEDRAARPISGRDGDETARRAANLVLNRAWALARDVVSLPPPSTLEGLRASALASAMLCEAESSTEDPTTVAAIGLTRAVLAVTGTPLPPGFVGFGDEPDYKQRDRALFDPPGSLPAWASRRSRPRTPPTTTCRRRPSKLTTSPAPSSTVGRPGGDDQLSYQCERRGIGRLGTGVGTARSPALCRYGAASDTREHSGQGPRLRVDGMGQHRAPRPVA